MRATILGLGEWLPEQVRDNGAWAPGFGRDAKATNREMVEMPAGDEDPCERILARRSQLEEGDPFLGARLRRVADESLSSSEAEARAGRAALADAGVDAEHVDVVLSWAMVPDRIAPANAPKVAVLVGAKRASAIGIEAACASGIAQIELATALVESGRARTVLCTQSHLFARANPLSHPASPLFGDAATAFVVGASERPGVVASRIATHGEYYDGVTWLRGRDEDPPWYRAGGPFFAGSKDKEVTLALARRWVRLAVDTVNELCASARRDVASIDVLATVQPRRWMPGAIAEGLGLPEERAPITFDTIAHVGGCGVVTNLLEARRRGLLTEGKRVALYAVGAGVTRAAVLIDWTLSR